MAYGWAAGWCGYAASPSGLYGPCLFAACLLSCYCSMLAADFCVLRGLVWPLGAGYRVGFLLSLLGACSGLVYRLSFGDWYMWITVAGLCLQCIDTMPCLRYTWGVLFNNAGPNAWKGGRSCGMGMEFVRDDGGREAAGYSGVAGDCVTRAIAIATGTPYADVYAAMATGAKSLRLLRERGRSPRDGVSRKVYEKYLRAIGWTFHPTMGIGTGARVHMRADELPAGRIIVRLSKHLAAVVDGVVHDTHDCTRDGTRCVYGYYAKA